MNENVNKPSAYEQCCHNTICAEGKKTAMWRHLSECNDQETNSFYS